MTPSQLSANEQNENVKPKTEINLCDVAPPKEAEQRKTKLPHKTINATQLVTCPLQPTKVRERGETNNVVLKDTARPTYAEIARRSNDVKSKAENSNGVKGKAENRTKTGESEISSLFQNNPIAKTKN